ncbi:hypothetical protein PVIIG_00830, partial [Plasmodium vivax India VII]
TFNKYKIFHDYSKDHEYIHLNTLNFYTTCDEYYIKIMENYIDTYKDVYSKCSENYTKKLYCGKIFSLFEKNISFI